MKLVKWYMWSITLYGAEIWALWEVDHTRVGILIVATIYLQLITK